VADRLLLFLWIGYLFFIAKFKTNLLEASFLPDKEFGGHFSFAIIT